MRALIIAILAMVVVMLATVAMAAGVQCEPVCRPVEVTCQCQCDGGMAIGLFNIITLDEKIRCGTVMLYHETVSLDRAGKPTIVFPIHTVKWMKRVESCE
jgi:hypothetical protein